LAIKTVRLMILFIRKAAIFFFVFFSLFSNAQEKNTAQDTLFSKENYVKENYKIPMREHAPKS
jgi:hypothetical protein